MKRHLKLVTRLLVVGLVVWGVISLIPSDEKRIQKLLTKIAGLTSFTGKESLFARAQHAAALADCFTADIVIELKVPGVGSQTANGRESVRETALAAFAMGGSVKVEFLDINVIVAPDKQTATAKLTATITTSGTRDFGVQEFHFQLRKEEEAGWLISRVENVRSLGL